MNKPKIVKLPEDFRAYPAGDSPTDGEVMVDLGVWKSTEGVAGRYCIRIDVQHLATLVQAIDTSPHRSKTLYRSLNVFRVANDPQYK